MAGTRGALPRRALPQAEQIAAAVARLSSAQRPLIILGGGALDGGAAALAIAEKLNAPILTTTAGKGAVPEDHPLCMGYRLGLDGAPAFIRSADAILCAGSQLSETDFWSEVVIDENLIRIDIDPDSLARPHTAEIAINADARAALEAIAEGLSQQKGPGRGEISKLRTDELDTVIADENRRLAHAGAGGDPRSTSARDRHLLRHDADRLSRQQHLPRLRSRTHGSTP